nr:ORF6 [Carpet python nidovirus 1]
MYIFMIFIVITLVSSSYCGFNGTKIEPRKSNLINHPFMIWNDENFVCMTCFNESGDIYYYHPSVNFGKSSKIDGYFLVDFNQTYKGNSKLRDYYLLFEHSNKSFLYFNVTANQTVSLLAAKYLVNESFYFDSVSPFILNGTVAQVLTTSASYPWRYSLGVLVNITDDYYQWLFSSINSSIVLGSKLFGLGYRVVNYASSNLATNISTRFRLGQSLGMPRYFPTTAKACPTLTPLVTKACPKPKSCQNQVRTVIVTKAAPPAPSQKSKILAIPTLSPELSICKEQLNSFTTALVIVLCCLLAAVVYLMYNCKSQQQQTKSSIY